MSDILIAIPSELIRYNHDGTITIMAEKIPHSWTFGVTDISLKDFLNEKVVGYCREPPTFKVITKIEVKLELEGKEQNEHKK